MRFPKPSIKIFLGFLLAAQVTRADYQKITQKTLFNGDKLTEFRLKNGFRVLMVPRHQAKVLTYQVWFSVGSLNEKMDPKLKKTGLAHLFEHMMFRGTEKYPDGKFDEIAARIGGDHQNASTYYYRTNYFESIPSNQLDTLMQLESDRMMNLKLSAELLSKEKGAVVGELRRHLDNPSGVASDELQKLGFTLAPYRWTVLGSEEEIKGFTLEEAQYFYKTFYAPNNATLIVIGDTSEEGLMKAVEKYYGPMVAQEIPKLVVPEEPRQKKERRLEIEHPQATSEVLMTSYHIPDIMSPSAPPLSLLGAHLSAGTEARLKKALVDNGIAVRASGGANSKPDVFEFYVQLAEGHHAEEALRILDREVRTLQTKPIDQNQFQRALNQELLGLYTDISDNSALGNSLGEYLMMTGDYLRGFEIIEGYQSLAPKDLMKVSKEYLNKDNRSVVIVRPPKTAGKKGNNP